MDSMERNIKLDGCENIYIWGCVRSAFRFNPMPLRLPCNYVGRLKLLSLESSARKHKHFYLSAERNEIWEENGKWAICVDSLWYQPQMTIKSKAFWSPGERAHTRLQRCVNKIFELLVKRGGIRENEDTRSCCVLDSERETRLERCDFSTQLAAAMKSD